MTGSTKSKEVEKLDAAIFFFKWSKKILETYSGSVKTNYLRVLIRHCTKARTVEDDDGSKMFDYSELGSDPRVIHDDRDDIKKRLKEGKMEMNDEEIKVNTPISLGELSALYRLKTLVRMCEKLTEIMTRMENWLDENKSTLKKHASSIPVFPHARKIFEAVCGIGEVFQLASINWGVCKHAALLEPTANEYKHGENSELSISTAKKYCPRLMSKINYFRSLVYLIGCSFTAVLETIFVKVPSERCEVRSRQINSILKSLPPQYLFTEDYQKLSRRTTFLLETPPKNEHSFPLVSQRKYPGSTRSSSKASKKSKKSLKIVVSKKSDKITARKYNKEDGSTENELKTAGSDKEDSKEKSKSKKKSGSSKR